jgi:uncharacterized protein YcnI
MKVRGMTILMAAAAATFLARAAVRRAGFLSLLTGILFAHITVRTDNNKAGGHAVYSVRVPNESETASTRRIEVQIPKALEASRYEPKSGWEIALAGGMLSAEGGAIGPGQFTEFRFQALNPKQTGTLKFTAIQTYDDGELVHWTGAPGSEAPAPFVEIVEAVSGGPKEHTHPH